MLTNPVNKNTAGKKRCPTDAVGGTPLSDASPPPPFNKIKERPIIFKSEEVQAILANRKTQTRRVVKSTRTVSPVRDIWEEWEAGVFGSCAIDGTTAIIISPYGTPGDRLWVRETWCNGDVVCGDHHPAEPEQLYVEQVVDSKDIIYKQAMIDSDICIEEVLWNPSIHMPRWASRILLEITDVRVEKLVDISDGDAVAEGVIPDAQFSNQSQFSTIWDSTNKKKGYPMHSNPWVWVIEFKKV